MLNFNIENIIESAATFPKWNQVKFTPTSSQYRVALGKITLTTCHLSFLSIQIAIWHAPEAEDLGPWWVA